MNPSEPAHDAGLGPLLLRWWWQGLRSLALRRPDWRGLVVTPGLLLVLVLVPLVLVVGLQRLAIPGRAVFVWHSVGNGGTLALLPWLLAAWLVGRHGAAAAQHDEVDRPATAQLFGLMCAQAAALALLAGVLHLAFAPATPGPRPSMAGTAPGAMLAGWVTWWGLVAQGLLLARQTTGGGRWRGLPLAGCLLLAVLLQKQLPPFYWYAPMPEPAEADLPPRFQLSQSVFEAQAAALQRDLAALEKPTADRGELFVLTFAPNAEEGVFQRESDLVAEVMSQRFGTRARTLQLMNLKQASPPRGWATPENLRRALNHIGRLMDPERDLLFIHLTSHGARNGALAPDFDPLAIEPLMPRQLKAWLDEAGIRWRIVSVSACYAGSWIGPLADPDTLVMTAADSEHTSYGCGRKSPLTYFGRAMYDEALRAGGSFEAAHARSRGVIAQREREAGKEDGFSNPQIAMGAELRPRLAALEARGRP